MVEPDAEDRRGVEVKTARKNLSSVIACAAFSLLGTTSVVASAEGLAARAADLPIAERTKLQAAIAEQKRVAPKSFAAVRELKGFLPENYRQFRNPIPQVGPELRHLGKAALFPMLDALVFDATPFNRASDEERRALVEGMLTEVGRLRDVRASAAVQAVFASSQPAAVVRTAGRAIGRLCDSSSRNVLKLALRDGARRLAALDGLGECRSVDAARALAAELATASSKDDAASLARALGNLGSSWAWQALGASRQAEGIEAGDVIAAALVRSYGRYDGDARAAHRTALTMVESADTARHVTAHRASVDETTATELDAIVKAIAASRGGK